MCSARKRPCSTLMSVSPVQWMTRVGTWTDDRISLISIWLTIRTTAMAAAGLAPSRSKRPHHCFKAGSSRCDGAHIGRLRPLPDIFEESLQSLGGNPGGTGKGAIEHQRLTSLG